MILVNYAHPLTGAQREQLEELLGQEIEQVIEVPAHFDNGASFAPQVAALVAATGLAPAEWQGERVMLVLPSFAPIAAALLAHLHGLAGYFPAAVRLRPVPGSVPPAFEVAELLDLNGIREAARASRWDGPQ